MAESAAIMMHTSRCGHAGEGIVCVSSQQWCRYLGQLVQGLDKALCAAFCGVGGRQDKASVITCCVHAPHMLNAHTLAHTLIAQSFVAATAHPGLRSAIVSAGSSPTQLQAL
jgi:hypothetical protein